MVVKGFTTDYIKHFFYSFFFRFQLKMGHGVLNENVKCSRRLKWQISNFSNVIYSMNYIIATV